MPKTTRSRQRALILGLRFLLSICSAWIHSAPVAAVPDPLSVAVRAVARPAQLASAIDRKKVWAMSVRRVPDRH